ncbi:MCE family protein [Streptomyces sp. NBC_01803]|uniref:MCE family protein n=1 Tax=Streptomyces sp. NBC_01803 TaxID=2975946 RepID=UPI002DD8DCFC|nr:MCE family protein [Streptomyces sp. NBC_01803]WSA43561.1 MCE family protein [Streptomyces sp. NBC_01803]
MKRGARIGIGVGAAGLAVAVVFAVSTVNLSELPTVADLPLPGGADLGDHPYEVTAEFEDVLSLVPHSTVKVNDVAVGRVTEIEITDDGWHALVTMEINGDIELPANAFAAVEQASLLGEKFVQLSSPEEPEGSLDNGAVIPVTQTNRNAEVEEVFGALSLVLNGGGVDQIRTISEELNNALEGNEAEARSVLDQLDVFVGDLDDHREDITDALHGMDRLASTLATRDEAIGDALDNLAPGLEVLEEQRESLMTMLDSLDQLGDVAIETINQSADDIVADLEALAPTLRNLADAGQALPDSLEVLATYPFTDEVMNGIRGDYLNAYLTIAAQPGTEIVPPVGSSSTRSAPLPLPSVGGDD